MGDRAAAVLALCILMASPTPSSSMSFMKARLIAEELLEHGDTISSMLYIVAADRRFQRGEFPNPVCPDDKPLRPLRATECVDLDDLARQDLPMCVEAEVGETCQGNGTCDEDLNLQNCPLAMGPLYRKEGQSCDPFGSCETLGGLLAFTALISMAFTFYINYGLLTLEYKVESDPHPGFVICCGCNFASVVLWGLWAILRFAAGLDSALSTGGFLVLLCIFRLVEHLLALLFIERKDAKFVVLTEMPFVGLVTVFVTPDEEIEQWVQEPARGVLKVLLRFTEDFPEIIVTSLELHYFGNSWWGVLDLAFSVALVAVHLAVQTARFARFQLGIKPKEATDAAPDPESVGARGL